VTRTGWSAAAAKTSAEERLSSEDWNDVRVLKGWNVTGVLEDWSVFRDFVAALMYQH